MIASLLNHSNTLQADQYTHDTVYALKAAVECAGGKKVTMASQTTKQSLKQVAVNS
jgi:hypothetical protein